MSVAFNWLISRLVSGRDYRFCFLISISPLLIRFEPFLRAAESSLMDSILRRDPGSSVLRVFDNGI